MDELNLVRTALQDAIGKSAYAQYNQLLEAFLSGRLGKGELEGALRVLLGHSLDNFDMHNKLLGLVLARLAAAEARAVAEWQRAQAAAHVEQEVGEGFRESAQLCLSSIEFNALDEQLFGEATKQPLPECPLAEEDEQASRRYRVEFAAAEKNLGRPLLAAISRQLPDESAIRALLASWLRAYDLEVSSMEEEHILLIQQALYDYLDDLIEGVVRRRPIFKGNNHSSNGSGSSNSDSGHNTNNGNVNGACENAATINVNKERLQAAARTNAILLS